MRTATELMSDFASAMRDGGRVTVELADVDRPLEVLAAEVDVDGSLGGDVGDVVVSLVGDSRAWAPDDEVDYRVESPAQDGR